MTLSNDQFSAQHQYAASLYGQGHADALFGRSSITPAPWPRAGRLKSGSPYNNDVISSGRNAPPELHSVDPRSLHSTQPSVLREHVSYYLNDPTYTATGRTARDQHLDSNQYPEVYERPDGRRDLLSGHHRAAAALLRGEPLRARLYRETP